VVDRKPLGPGGARKPVPFEAAQLGRAWGGAEAVEQLGGAVDITGLETVRGLVDAGGVEVTAQGCGQIIAARFFLLGLALLFFGLPAQLGLALQGFPRLAFLRALEEVGADGEGRDQEGQNRGLNREGKAALGFVKAADGFAGMQQQQILPHLGGAGVTLLRIRRARLLDDLPQLQQFLAVCELAQTRRRLGEILPVFAGADFVKHFAQAIEVRLGGAGAFGRNEPFRAHKGNGHVGVSDQADVGQLGDAVHEDDVGGLDVAVDQAVLVQMGQGRRQGKAEFQALSYRQPAPALLLAF